MGDKSPKSTQKKAGQKQAEKNREAQKKRDAEAAKRPAGAKK